MDVMRNAPQQNASTDFSKNSTAMRTFGCKCSKWWKRQASYNNLSKQQINNISLGGDLNFTSCYLLDDVVRVLAINSATNRLSSSLSRHC